MEDIKIDEMLLDESAKTDFKSKFGDETLNVFDKAKQRLVNNGYSPDYGQYLKYTKDQLMKLLTSVYDAEKDAQKIRILNGEDKQIRGKYKYLGEHGKYKVYKPLDYISSMDLGVNTGWCTTGRYEHAGHPEFTPNARAAKMHFDEYTSNGVQLYYFLDKDTMYGEYAIALYPTQNKCDIYTDDKYIVSINFEMFNSEDDNIILDKPYMFNKEIYDIAISIGIPLKMETKNIVGDGLIIEDDGNEKIVKKCLPEYLHTHKINSITIPDGVTSINNFAFAYCSSLTSITIPNSATSISKGAFLCCSSLTSITIPDSVTFIGDYAFLGCSSLTSITLSDSLTAIGEEAFRYCSSLTSITIPNSVTDIGSYAFEYCYRLQSIIIPKSVVYFGVDVFKFCDGLKKIIFESKDTYYNIIKKHPDSLPYNSEIVFADDDNKVEESLNMEDNKIEEIENFIEDIYDLRKTSIANDGEYAIGNLVFKEMRNRGYLDNLKDLKNELKSKELSLESLTKQLDSTQSELQESSREYTGYVERWNLKYYFDEYVKTISEQKIIDLISGSDIIGISDSVNKEGPQFITKDGKIIYSKDLSSGIDTHENIIDVICDLIFTDKFGDDYEKGYKYYDIGDVGGLRYFTYNLSWARINPGTPEVEERFYCVLPDNMTSSQFYKLDEFLGLALEKGVSGVSIFATSLATHKYYVLGDENTPEDVIKKIKRFYTTGMFVESVITEDAKTGEEVNLENVKKWLKSDGATISCKSRKAVNYDSGYEVSYFGSEETFKNIDFENDSDIQKIVDAVDKKIKEAKYPYVGLWVNDGIVYLDYSKRIISKKRAIKFGIEQKQLAILDWSKPKTSPERFIDLPQEDEIADK